MIDGDDERGIARGHSSGGFIVGDLLSHTGEVRLYQAEDPRLNRRVRMMVAGGRAADDLRDAVKRVAAIAHPNVVPVLAAGSEGEDAYAVTPDVPHVSLREFARTRPPSPAVAAHLVIQLASASEALASAGVRIPIDLDSAFVTMGSQGGNALIDPLATVMRGEPLAPADTASSVRELADLLGEITPAPTPTMSSAVAAVHRGEFGRPAQLGTALASEIDPHAPRSTRPSRAAWVGIGAVGVLAVAAVVFALTRDDGAPTARGRTTASTATAAARVVARVPLGLKKSELPLAIGFQGTSAWISTSRGRLVHVDSTVNQVVGTPATIASGKQLTGVAASAKSIWVTSDAGTLFRIDPARGRVSGKLVLGKGLNGVRAAGGVLWVLRANLDAAGLFHGTVVRVSPTSMRRIGTPIPVMPYPFGLVARGPRIWVLGNYTSHGAVMRIDTDTGKRSSINVGYQAADIGLQGTTVWVTDHLNGTATPINGNSMRYGSAIHVNRSALGVATSAADTWVTVSATEALGNVSLARFDSRTHRRAGHAVRLGTGGIVAVRPDGVWVLGNDLVRLNPTTPRPALAPAATESAPRRLIAGPLPAGSWHASSFIAPLTLSVPAYRWISIYPTRSGLGFINTYGDRRELDIFAPDTVWVSDAKSVPVGDPKKLLAQIRTNRRLVVGKVLHVALGGKRALQFTVSAKNPLRHADLCNEPCVPIFSSPLMTFTANKGEFDRFTLVASQKRTIVVAESGGQTEDYAALLRTFRFTR